MWNTDTWRPSSFYQGNVSCSIIISRVKGHLFAWNNQLNINQLVLKGRGITTHTFMIYSHQSSFCLSVSHFLSPVHFVFLSLLLTFSFILFISVFLSFYVKNFIFYFAFLK